MVAFYFKIRKISTCINDLRSAQWPLLPMRHPYRCKKYIAIKMKIKIKVDVFI